MTREAGSSGRDGVTGGIEKKDSSLVCFESGSSLNTEPLLTAALPLFVPFPSSVRLAEFLLAQSNTLSPNLQTSCHESPSQAGESSDEAPQNPDSVFGIAEVSLEEVALIQEAVQREE